MRDFLKRVGKIILYAVLWVFILSIRMNGRTLFSYGNDFLIQNSIVRTVDEHLAEGWYRLNLAIHAAFDGENHKTPKG